MNIARSLHHMWYSRGLVLLTPLDHPVPIAAFMQRVEIRPWRFSLRNPVVSDDAHVGVAGQFLSEHLDAVVLR